MFVKNNFKLNALYAAMLATTSMGVQAQEEKTEQAEAIEVIEVTGLRGSLSKSLNDKRFSKSIVDTINAEDVGKNTDQNIADALGRVTGVSIVSRPGEGSQITIRGATSNQNNISLNGQQLTSTDFNQAVDLSSYSADILSKLEVVKTSSADQDEGSLGGSVNLTTIRPLDRRDVVRTGEIQGRYNDFSEENDYKIQFTGTEKFLDETLGVALSVYDETTSLRRDQYRVDNFVESIDHFQATDQHGEVLSNVRGIKHNATNYELIQNETHRSGGTLGIQWIATDTTDLMLDVTYSKQKLERTNDAIKTRSGTGSSFVEGQNNVPNYPTDSAFVSPFTDPFADWVHIDTDTHTLIKEVGRFSSGDISRTDGGDDQTNLNATLNINHTFSDYLSMSVLLGHSKSKTDSLPDNAYTNMQNWHQVPGPKMFEAGHDVMPTGYDCTSGKCIMVSGDAIIDLGEHNEDYIDADGISRARWYDNTNVLSGFNPADLKSFHLGSIAQTDVSVEDSMDNIQVDFDWDVEFGPIVNLEFGAKYQEREKYVDNQRYNFSSSNQTVVIEDPVTGTKTIIAEGALDGIYGNDLAAPGGLGVDNFMDSLGYPQDHLTQGLSPIDVKYAKGLILDDESTVFNIDDTQTRKTNIDTTAVYFKANFEFLDGKLTGDIGVRYVETDVKAVGASGANWWSHADTNLSREFSFLKLKELRDTSLPECPAQVGDGEFAYQRKWGRVDGLGWDTSAGPDPAGWVRQPDVGPCHDANYATWYENNTEFAGLTEYPAGHPNAGDPLATVVNPNWGNMYRYADVSGTHFWDFDDEAATTSAIIWDSSVALNTQFTDGYTVPNVQNRRVTAVPTSDKTDYSNVLPSMNLNYAFSDELVGRFAVSKTMTRPEIDLLRPGFSLNQGAYWGGNDSEVGSRLSQFNTKLKPLESNNIDVSLEWYFNPTGMVSIAIFDKDMSNFTETQSDQSYVRDFRNDEGAIDPNSLLIDDVSQTDDSHLNGCLSLMATADYPFTTANPPAVSNDLHLLCDFYNTSKVVNGKGAQITGVELGYSQTYEFLPGFLSGLGMSANYTYQDSKYDSDDSDAAIKLPDYPVADTPEHTYNLMTFWEQDGHQIRLSYRGTSDTLVGTDYNTGLGGRIWNQGTLWNEGRDSLDLSMTYKVNDNVSLSFQATNLTDDSYRTYFTSRTLVVDRVAADNPAGFEYVPLVEGNPLEGDATKSRTYTESKVGRTYRLGVRVNF